MDCVIHTSMLFNNVLLREDGRIRVELIKIEELGVGEKVEISSSGQVDLVLLVGQLLHGWSSVEIVQVLRHIGSPTPGSVVRRHGGGGREVLLLVWWNRERIRVHSLTVQVAFTLSARLFLCFVRLAKGVASPLVCPSRVESQS